MSASPSSRRRAAVLLSPGTSGAAVSIAVAIRDPVTSSASPLMAIDPSRVGERVIPARSYRRRAAWSASSGSSACPKARIRFATARTSASAAAATASGSISATAPAGASTTPLAITWACRPEIAPSASAAWVFGSTPVRSTRAVRTRPAASAGVARVSIRSQAAAVSAPSLL